MSTFKPDIIVPQEWIGVDFNRTLAEYHSYHDDMRDAKPLEQMVARVKQWLAEGKVVKILSAQVWMPNIREYLAQGGSDQEWIKEAQAYRERAEQARMRIKTWCLMHLGHQLEVTCERDPGCKEVWDDKAWHVIPNVGAVPGPPYVGELPPPTGRGGRSFQVFEEAGHWPPLPQTDPSKSALVEKIETLIQKSPNIMGWGNEKMGGVSTFSDAEIQRAYWKMMERLTGHGPSELSPAAETLAAYCARFHKPPLCVFSYPDSATDIAAQPD